MKISSSIPQHSNFENEVDALNPQPNQPMSEPLAGIIFKFREHVKASHDSSTNLAPLAEKIKILSENKLDYYKSSRFGFIKKFFSSLYNFWKMGTFTSSGQLGKELTEEYLARAAQAKPKPDELKFLKKPNFDKNLIKNIKDLEALTTPSISAKKTISAHQAQKIAAEATSSSKIKEKEITLLIHKYLFPEALSFQYTPGTPGNPNPISQIQALSLFTYTTSFYNLINAHAGKDEKAFEANFKENFAHVEGADLEEAKQLVEAILPFIDQALDQLPDYEGACYRGFRARNSQLEQYEAGKIISAERFTSTSEKIIHAFAFLNSPKTYVSPVDEPRTGVIFEIKSKKGKSIGPYSMMRGENEILFKRGTQFKAVKSEDMDKEGCKKIYLEEID